MIIGCGKMAREEEVCGAVIHDVAIDGQRCVRVILHSNDGLVECLFDLSFMSLCALGIIIY